MNSTPNSRKLGNTKWNGKKMDPTNIAKAREDAGVDVSSTTLISFIDGEYTKKKILKKHYSSIKQ